MILNDIRKLAKTSCLTVHFMCPTLKTIEFSFVKMGTTFVYKRSISKFRIYLLFSSTTLGMLLACCCISSFLILHAWFSFSWSCCSVFRAGPVFMCCSSFYQIGGLLLFFAEASNTFYWMHQRWECCCFTYTLKL